MIKVVYNLLCLFTFFTGFSSLNLNSSFERESIILEKGIHEINGFVQLRNLQIHAGADIIYNEENSSISVTNGSFSIINSGNDKIKFFSKYTIHKHALLTLANCSVHGIRNLEFNGVGLRFINIKNNINLL